MAERNAKKILVQILQQASDEATSPDPCDLGVLADRFLERWQPAPLTEDLRGEIDEARTYVAQHNHPVNPEWTLRDVLVDFVERLKCERDSLLPRLADFTQAAGKQRSTEWLRLCASLPMEEWPPAPAYKGPMVPAAELEALQARLSTIAETLSRAAGMMASDSRDWGRDRSDVWLYGLIVAWECEEQHEHDDVMCGGDGALREAAAQHGWTADDVARIRGFRAALQAAVDRARDERGDA